MCHYVAGQHGDGDGLCPDGAAQAMQRPKLMHFMHTAGLVVRQVRASNSPFFFIAPQYSRDVLVEDVVISAPASSEAWAGHQLNPWPSHNTDGINVESCSNVLLQRLEIATGDDCVAIYSGSNE